MAPLQCRGYSSKIEGARFSWNAFRAILGWLQGARANSLKQAGRGALSSSNCRVALVILQIQTQELCLPPGDSNSASQNCSHSCCRSTYSSHATNSIFRACPPQTNDPAQATSPALRLVSRVSCRTSARSCEAGRRSRPAQRRRATRPTAQKPPSPTSPRDRSTMAWSQLRRLPAD